MGVGIRPDKKEDTQLIRRFLLRIGAPDKKTVPVLSYSVFAYKKGGTFRANGNGVQADSRGTDNKKC